MQSVARALARQVAVMSGPKGMPVLERMLGFTKMI